MLILVASIEGYAQGNILITYKCESIGSYSTIGTLAISNNKFWYSRKEENNTEVTEEGYEFYHYKDYSDWYYNLDNQTITQTKNSDNYPHLLAQWQANMEWEITEETTEIAGYKVQKAITTPLKEDYYPFMYEKTIAWFATEIPISGGPEGYYGLPGLIVKLEYAGVKAYNYTLMTLEYKTVKKWEVPDGEGKIKVTKNEIYNVVNINKKWLKQQKKLLKESN